MYGRNNWILLRNFFKLWLGINDYLKCLKNIVFGGEIYFRWINVNLDIV